MATTGFDHTLIRGWVSQPDTRGTFGLAFSCAATVFLCSWSSVCVNIPSPDHIRWDLFCDKWHMFCLSLLGPEFIFMLALGQYVSARASVQAFHTLDHKDWTLKHAFYADMGASSSNPMDGSHSQSMLHSYIIWWKRNTLTIRRSQRAKLMTKTSPTALQGR